MRVEILNYEDRWQAVKNATMNTIGKESGSYPDSEWKRKILLAEHSPIRLLTFTVRITDLPYWISVQLSRHKVGIEHYVRTQRTDRTGVWRGGLPQGALIDHTMVLNAQALINISRKRLCHQASVETRNVWMEVVDQISKYEPELASVCRPECIYRGFCPEMKSCGNINLPSYREERARYMGRLLPRSFQPEEHTGCTSDACPIEGVDQD